MKFAIFIRVPISGSGKVRRYRRRFNPYLQIGSFELAIDRDGIVIHTRRRSFGFLRGSGFWGRIG
jgi:hypothetical protein